jgi:hypothetical protein
MNNTRIYFFCFFINSSTYASEFITREEVDNLEEGEFLSISYREGADGIELSKEGDNTCINFIKFEDNNQLLDEWNKTKSEQDYTGTQDSFRSKSGENTRSHLSIKGSDKIFLQNQSYTHAKSIFVDALTARLKNCYFMAPKGVTFYSSVYSTCVKKYTIQFIPLKETQPILINGYLTTNTLEFQKAGIESSLLFTNAYMKIERMK